MVYFKQNIGQYKTTKWLTPGIFVIDDKGLKWYIYTVYMLPSHHY